MKICCKTHWCLINLNPHSLSPTKEGSRYPRNSNMQNKVT
uniref:Uncharacterized protein n=1 Tax=Rhizophora mucronata TaxID=61149 RepID=A0A2P2PEC7_RHIMU